MCIVLNGSSQFVSAASAVVTAYPFSLFAYFNPTVTNVAEYIFSSDNSGSATVNGFRLRAAGDAAAVVRGTTGDGTTTDAYSTGTTFVANTWQKAVIVATSATSRSVWLNNGGQGTAVGNIVPTGINRTLIGATELLAVISGWFNGSLAHAAIWNIALTTQDRNMLQAGYSPRLIQIPSLKAYLPFWDSAFGVTDLYGATSWAAQASPTYGADPGIKYNSNNMMMGMT